MDSFSLRKYWKSSGSSSAPAGGAAAHRSSNIPSTTIFSPTSPSHTSSETEDNEDEDGPFFDLEFSLPVEDSVKKDENVEDVECDDDLFFVPVMETSSPNSKSQVPVSLLKPATKFRVSMLKSKKINSKVKSGDAKPKVENQQPQNKKKKKKKKKQRLRQMQSKFSTVKFKVDAVPIVSMFTRDNSSTSPNNKAAAAAAKQDRVDSGSGLGLDEKKCSKDVMQKYIKMVSLKSFYIRMSKRYGDKLRFFGQLSLPEEAKACAAPPPSVEESTSTATAAAPLPVVKAVLQQSNVKNEKRGNLQAGLRVVCKHLGKSRLSASAVVVEAAAPSEPTASKRRDDSLLQQQDGIQSAILHCKTSFNASPGYFIWEAAKMKPNKQLALTELDTDSEYVQF